VEFTVTFLTVGAASVVAEAASEAVVVRDPARIETV
jgi:serine acetyltransferase